MQNRTTCHCCYYIFPKRCCFPFTHFVAICGAAVRCSIRCHFLASQPTTYSAGSHRSATTPIRLKRSMALATVSLDCKRVLRRSWHCHLLLRVRFRRLLSIHRVDSPGRFTVLTGACDSRSYDRHELERFQTSKTHASTRGRFALRFVSILSFPIQMREMECSPLPNRKSSNLFFRGNG